MRAEVFNGDADGLCALRLWRGVHGKADCCITGVKRDIALVQKIQQTPRQLAVFDLSFAVNAEPVRSLLEAGCEVHYFDHHFSGALPSATNFHATIAEDPDCCTAILTSQALYGKALDWAIVGAFGDNLLARAQALGEDLDPTHLAQLQHLGVLLNYNGYGLRIEDLHVDPHRLIDELDRYSSARDCLLQSAMVQKIQSGYEADQARVRSTQPYLIDDSVVIYRLEDAAWARRSMGILANRAVHQYPDKAVAVAVAALSQTLMISLRAPLENPTGAGEFAARYPHAGGRAVAAGINRLAVQDFEAFCSEFSDFYRGL